MSAKELANWQLYEEQFGSLDRQARSEMMLAQVCAVIASANRKRGSSPAKVSSFVPRWLKTKPQKPNSEEVAAKFRSLMRHGVRSNHKREP